MADDWYVQLLSQKKLTKLAQWWIMTFRELTEAKCPSQTVQNKTPQLTWIQYANCSLHIWMLHIYDTRWLLTMCVEQSWKCCMPEVCCQSTTARYWINYVLGMCYVEVLDAIVSHQRQAQSSNQLLNYFFFSPSISGKNSSLQVTTPKSIKQASSIKLILHDRIDLHIPLIWIQFNMLGIHVRAAWAFPNQC